MTIVVEDGTGFANANSYASEDTLSTYADDRGYTLASGDAESALIRATMYIDTYRFRFPGYRVKGRSQGLEWPRYNAYTQVPSMGRELPGYGHHTSPNTDFLGISVIPSNVVPIEIVQATCEAAIRELATPNSMQPDMDRGGLIRSIKAGSVSIDYADNAPAGSTSQIIDNILAGILIGENSALFGSTVRG